MEKRVASRKVSPDGFHCSRLGCGEKGYRRSRCPRGQRTRSLDREGGQRSCRDCGQEGYKSSDCSKPKEAVQAGNGGRLEKGAERQPPTTSGPRTE